MQSVRQQDSRPREDRILEAAAACIEESSLLDFTMSGISRMAGLSMGSIYTFIQSKEDVLVALGCQSRSHFEQVVQKIFALPLPAAARIMAIQLVDQRHTSPYSFGPQLVMLLGNEAILKRASPGWVDRYIQEDIALERRFEAHIEQACDAGELTVGEADRKTLIREINTAVWSMYVGYIQVSLQRSVRSLAPDSVLAAGQWTIVTAMQKLLNTYPWKTPVNDELLEQTIVLLEQQGLR